MLFFRTSLRIDKDVCIVYILPSLCELCNFHAVSGHVIVAVASGISSWAWFATCGNVTFHMLCMDIRWTLSGDDLFMCNMNLVSLLISVPIVHPLVVYLRFPANLTYVSIGFANVRITCEVSFPSKHGDIPLRYRYKYNKR